jgi:hypothetical protein
VSSLLERGLSVVATLKLAELPQQVMFLSSPMHRRMQTLVAQPLVRWTARIQTQQETCHVIVRSNSTQPIQAISMVSSVHRCSSTTVVSLPVASSTAAAPA